MKNEEKFKNWLNLQNNFNFQHSHKRWTSQCGNDIHISVDFQLTEDNDKHLIEVDSGNMAKLLVGQYTLLNLIMNPKERMASDFWVVHFYKNYNCHRTIKNLEFVRNKLPIQDPLSFNVVHWNHIKHMKGLKSINEVLL